MKDSNISKSDYEAALKRIEELVPLVDDCTPADHPYAIELASASDRVIEYEKKYYPLGSL